MRLRLILSTLSLGLTLAGLAGGGGGGAGAAFTGNKEIVLPAESAVAFENNQAIEIKQ